MASCPIEVLDKWNGISYDPKLEIGNHVMIGQDFHVACADSIKIEDNVLISAGVFITDLDHVTADKTKPVLEQGICTKPVQIGEGTFIGKDCMILSGSQNRKTLCHWSKYSSDKKIFQTMQQR